MTIAVISASLRRGSLNTQLAEALPALAPPDFAFHRLTGLERFPPYDADHQTAGFPEVVVDWAERIAACDGVVIVSPEYNYSYPGVLKNALDWLSRLRPNPFTQKPVALQSAAPGFFGGVRMQHHLRQVLVCLDAQVLNGPEVFVTQAAEKFDAQGAIADAATRQVISAQMQAFHGFILKCRAAPHSS